MTGHVMLHKLSVCPICCNLALFYDSQMVVAHRLQSGKNDGLLLLLVYYLLCYVWCFTFALSLQETQMLPTFYFFTVVNIKVYA